MAAICIQVRAQLEAMIDGDLDGEDARRLRAHLAECVACRAHHAEASSLPNRLAALGGPEPSPVLLEGVLRRVRGETIGPVRLWGPLAVELLLFVVALWYVSGFEGLSRLVQRTASDAGSLIGWGVGQSDLPAPMGDVFLLLVCGLLVVTTLYHLALLARQGPRFS